MASPSFIDKGTYGFGDGPTVTPAYPAGVQAGDILIILAFSQQEGVTIGGISTPAGYSNLGGGGISDSVPNPIGGFQVFYKIADGTESGTINVTRTGDTGPSTLFIAQIYLIRGSGAVALESGRVGNVGSSSTITYQSINLTGNERLLLALVVQNDDSGVGTPTGYTLGASDDVPSVPTGQVALFYLEDAASDGLVTSIGGSSEGWGTFHMAVFNVRGRSFIVN